MGWTVFLIRGMLFVTARRQIFFEKGLRTVTRETAEEDTRCGKQYFTTQMTSLQLESDARR